MRGIHLSILITSLGEIGNMVECVLLEGISAQSMMSTLEIPTSSLCCPEAYDQLIREMITY
jgi:hypothetical protein